MNGSGKKQKNQLMSDGEEDQAGKVIAASTEGPTGLGFVVQTEKKKPGRKPKRDNDNNNGESEEEPASSGLVKRSQGGYVKKQHQNHLPTPGLVQQPFKRKRGRPAKNEQINQMSNQQETYGPGYGKMGGNHPRFNQAAQQEYGGQSSRDRNSSYDMNDASGVSENDHLMDVGQQDEGGFDENFEEQFSGGDLHDDDDDGMGLEDDDFGPRGMQNANPNGEVLTGGLTESDYQKFTDKGRITQVYQAMNDVEQERFELYRQSNFNEKQMKKILSMIPGTGKINPKVSAIIRSIAKIYVGQLVEESKTIQIQEIRDQIEYKDNLKRQQMMDYSDSHHTLEDLKIPELGSIHPYHLMEARRRLLEKGELVADKPKPMFPRRPRF